jgi:hypothetical protein
MLPNTAASHPAPTTAPTPGIASIKHGDEAGSGGGRCADRCPDGRALDLAMGLTARAILPRRDNAVGLRGRVPGVGIIRNHAGFRRWDARGFERDDGPIGIDIRIVETADGDQHDTIPLRKKRRIGHSRRDRSRVAGCFLSSRPMAAP